MLTKEATRIIALFGSVFLVALFMGNLIILYVSLVLLLTLLFGLRLTQPCHIEIKRRETQVVVWAGEVIELSSEVVIKDGIGVVTLAQELPSDFNLVAGNNLRICSKGLNRKSFVFSFKVKCTKRGSYTLSGINWESRHVLGLRKIIHGSEGPEVSIAVRPRMPILKQVRGLPEATYATVPTASSARTGLFTTDFREIRNYVQGDPIRAINWKATARQLSKGELWPLVNEYEVEGKKAAWIFLDSSASMEVGTTVENSFEYALEAATGVARYFLDRSYCLGMYIYNNGSRVFYPDVGQKQSYRISSELIDLATSEKYDELLEAIEKCKKYLFQYNPLCIIISRLDSQFSESLLDGAKKLTVLRGSLRKGLPIMVISVAGYNIIPKMEEHEDNTAVLMYLKTRPLVNSLRRLGVSVLEWNPTKENFANSLLRQVRIR